jgi:hypothetical protein
VTENNTKLTRQFLMDNRNSIHEENRSFWRSCVGIIFFGTPHPASKLKFNAGGLIKILISKKLIVDF